MPTPVEKHEDPKPTVPKAGSPFGKATNRIDGPLKVTGTAKYTSDHNFPGMLYAVPVGATISSGTVTSIDTKDALVMPGVKGLYHRANLSKLFRVAPNPEGGDINDGAFSNEHRAPFEDDEVKYYGQYVAVAVADTFEHARAAADAVKISYNQKQFDVSAKLVPTGKVKNESTRGDAQKAFDEAALKIDETYVTPTETHNVIELHASVATFDGVNFTLYETTQGVIQHRNTLAQVLGVERENVRVITKFLGSGFGGKLAAWPQSALAAGLSRQLGCPIKCVVSRKQSFHAVGHRPLTQQRVRISASADGRLTSIQHDYLNHSSMLEEYKENCGECTKYLYSCPNVNITSAIAKRNVGGPAPMRGPGAVPGLFATESAIDEMARKLKIDPVQMRVINEPTMDEGSKIPFASRHYIDCYKRGAEIFGWENYKPEIGSMQKNGLKVGWGIAGAAWIAERFSAEVTVELRSNGTARALTGMCDIGTGSYTVIALTAADKLGIPVEKIDVVLGDSALPPGALSGGSMGASSVVPAVSIACDRVINAVLTTAAKTPQSKYYDCEVKELAWENGMVYKKGEQSSEGVPFQQLLDLANYKIVTGRGHSAATPRGKSKTSTHSYGCHFVEVTYQEEIARLRISRIVTIIDGGKIINPKTARNQIEGSVVMGIGMALFEETHYEPTKGAPLNSNLADYIVAVNADVPKLEVEFLEYPNTELNEYGTRGVGEIGLAGIARSRS